jgi:large subunit ribosomal protein L9
MQLILKKDVQNLGEVGDLVTVKDGYARNFLIPNNMATPATKGAIADRERNIARIKAKSEKLHNQALETAKKLEGIGLIEFSVKAGESGKLFGTITTKKLAEEILAKSSVEIDRKTIIVDNPINKVGEYTVTVKLTSKIKAQLKVNVSASETIKEAIIEEAEEVKEEITKEAE